MILISTNILINPFWDCLLRGACSFDAVVVLEELWALCGDTGCCTDKGGMQGLSLYYLAVPLLWVFPILAGRAKVSLCDYRQFCCGCCAVLSLSCGVVSEFLNAEQSLTVIITSLHLFEPVSWGIMLSCGSTR